MAICRAEGKAADSGSPNNSDTPPDLTQQRGNSSTVDADGDCTTNGAGSERDMVVGNPLRVVPHRASSFLV